MVKVPYMKSLTLRVCVNQECRRYSFIRFMYFSHFEGKNKRYLCEECHKQQKEINNEN